jgi:hypothetical protein
LTLRAKRRKQESFVPEYQTASDVLQTAPRRSAGKNALGEFCDRP